MKRTSGGGALAIFWLATVAGASSAEPIKWTYSASGGVYNYGSEDRPLSLRIDPVPTQARTFDGSISWTVYPAGNWTVDDPTPVSFGEVGPIPVTVTVTDSASSESGQFVIPYLAYFDDLGGRQNLYMARDLETTLDLGGNEYLFRGSRWNTSLSAEVRPAVATPEPATLALAGLGLAAVAARRAGRRRSLTKPAA